MQTDPALKSDVYVTVSEKIVGIIKKSELDEIVSIGSLFVEYFYAGDINSFPAEQISNNIHLKKLAACPTLPIPPAKLYRIMRIYGLLNRMEEEGIALGELTVAHLTKIVTLSYDEQLLALKKALRYHWSVGRIVKYIEEKTGQGNGRFSLPKVVRTVYYIAKYMDVRYFSELDTVNTWSRGRIEKMLRIINGVVSQLQRVKEVLEERLKELKD